MKIEYNIAKEDYKRALIESLINEFNKRILIIGLLSFVISTVYVGNNFEWDKFIIAFMASALFIIVILFGRSIYNIYKTDKLVKNNPLYFGKKTIVLDNEGIINDTENQTKYLWKSINTIENLTNYLFITFQNNTFLAINKKELSNEDINNFIGRIKSEIPVKNINSNYKKSKNIYWLGLIGFIPNFGLISGAILVFLGFKRKDNKLKLIGLGNLLFTPLFWFLLLQITNNSNFFKKSNIEFTNHFLNEVVKDLEFYKSKNGHYPDSLGELRKQNKFFNDSEMFNENDFLKESKSAKFYYKKIGNDYELKSYGPDKILNTKDDIYPELKK
jgi:hypothetical protein